MTVATRSSGLSLTPVDTVPVSEEVRPGPNLGSRRPLFLNPALRGQIDLDGPALRLRAEHRAETRFPLDRVSRIIVGARVNWSARALQVCLERGIPIVIAGAGGAPLGSMLPVRVPALPLASALEELLCCPDWRDIYRRWQRAERMRMLAAWRQAQQAEGTGPDPAAYQSLVRRYVYRAGTMARETAGFWHSALYAIAVEALRRWGVTPVMWGDGGDALDLRRDLSDLLELRWRLEVRDDMAAALSGDATTLFVFHALTEKLEAEGRRIMHSLARRTNQVLSEWR
jgi:CRISPR associated protein, Cas1 family